MWYESTVFLHTSRTSPLRDRFATNGSYWAGTRVRHLRLYYETIFLFLLGWGMRLAEKLQNNVQGRRLEEDGTLSTNDSIVPVRRIHRMLMRIM